MNLTTNLEIVDWEKERNLAIQRQAVHPAPPNNPLDLIRPGLWLYGDDYDLAGFVFARVGTAVCPLESFQLSSDIDQSLDGFLHGIKQKHDIEWITVPRVTPHGSNAADERRVNLLYADIPQPYFSGRVIRCSPSFRQGRTVRARALELQTLDESHYKGRSKLIERLKQVSAAKPPSALVMAYLYAVNELLRPGCRGAIRPNGRYEANDRLAKQFR